MTNHPNRNWRKKWTYFPEDQTVSHIDGWVFQFVKASDTDGAYDGKLIQQSGNVDFTDPHISSKLANLARQAGEFYAEQRNKLS